MSYGIGKVHNWLRRVLAPTSAPAPREPDFFCVGAQKAGTTWLYYELARHPDVQLPKVKELRWFEDHQYSWDDYLHNFSEAGTRLTGDITPVYLVCQTAAEEMRRRVPTARVFAILRDPTERAFSQYRMLRWNKRLPETQTFLEAFWDDAVRMRTRGHYAEQLARYLEHYRLDDDLAVYFYDDLKSDPVAFIHRIDRFLGIREYASPQVGEQYLHPGYSQDGLTIAPEDDRVVRDYYRAHNDALHELLGRGRSWNAERSRRGLAA